MYTERSDSGALRHGVQPSGASLTYFACTITLDSSKNLYRKLSVYPKQLADSSITLTRQHSVKYALNRCLLAQSPSTELPMKENSFTDHSEGLHSVQVTRAVV